MQATGDDEVIGQPMFTLTGNGVTGSTGVHVVWTAGSPDPVTLEPNDISGRQVEKGQDRKEGNVLSTTITISQA